MSLVNLVSGGLDSTLVSVLCREEGLALYPLFVDYGQRSVAREWEACLRSHSRHGLPTPARLDIGGFGRLVLSGLTSSTLDVRHDAFTPTRNLMFLVMAGAYAHQVGVDSIAIGLLSERFSLFPDQRSDFVMAAEHAVGKALGREIKVLTPLAEFSKAEVVKLAAQKGIADTYSCHAGGELPCGRCIACLEFKSEQGGASGR